MFIVCNYYCFYIFYYTFLHEILCPYYHVIEKKKKWRSDRKITAWFLMKYCDYYNLDLINLN